MKKSGKKKGKKKIVLLIIVVLIILGFWACSKASANLVVNIVEVAQPEYQTLEDIVSISGTVESEEIKTYFAPVTGELGIVSVQVGDVVAEGDILVTYDMDEMGEVLEQARLQYITGNNSYNNSLADNTDAQKKLNEANSQLVVLETQIKNQKAYIKAMYEQLSSVQTERADAFAQENLEMQKNLIALQKDPLKNKDAIEQLQLAMQSHQYVAQKVNSTEDLVEYQKAITAEEEKLAEYEKKRAEMEAQKQSAEMGIMTDYQKDNLSVSEQLNLMVYENAQEDYAFAGQGIVADFDGIVTQVSAIEGMPVAKSTQLLTLANCNDVKVTFSVGKYQLAKLAIGQTAEIDISGAAYTGKISKINRMANVNAVNGSAQIGVEIHIDNPDDNIYLGLDAKVKILADKAENVLAIPTMALYADKEGDFVFVEENGIAVRKDIVTGISTTEYIEVKEGLSESDKVIVSSITVLEDGIPVLIVPDTDNLTEE